MFGTNRIATNENHEDGMRLKVQEVFRTIQGEGPFAGRPAIFVRLSGCNLRCHFCDTDFESSDWWPETTALVDAILEKSLGAWARTSLVVLTGGEPLIQNVGPLIQSLLARDFTVQIETAGTVWPDSLNERWAVDALTLGHLTIVCSPKTPTVNPMIHRWCNHWKYIVRAVDQHDTHTGVPITSTQTVDGTPRMLAYRAARFTRPMLIPGVPGIGQENTELPKPTVWLQPCDEHDDERTKINTEHAVALALRYDYNLCLQLHKMLGMP